MSDENRFTWLWWVLGIIALAAIGTGAFFYYVSQQSKPRIPPGLVEGRQAVANVLDQSDKLQDVDIKPLVDLEKKKDYQGAVNLMDAAIAANAKREDLAASLSKLSDQLSQLAVQVKPDDVGTKAINAFGILVKLADAEQKFYQDRQTLYELTKQYYADLLAKKNPAIPETLSSLVDQVNSDLAQAKNFEQQFSVAVKTFDDAIR